MEDKIKPLSIGDVCAIIVGAVPVTRVVIKDIVPDKKGWWAVTFVQVEQFMHPLEWFWLLDDFHMNQETFEMNGVPHRLAKIGNIDMVKEPAPKEKKVILHEESKNPKELF